MENTTPKTVNELLELIDRHQSQILRDWIVSYRNGFISGRLPIREEVLRRQAEDFLAAFRTAIETDPGVNLDSPTWEAARAILTDLSREQTKAGASPSAVATFVFALKEPLFAVIQTSFGNDPVKLAREMWSASTAIDRIGLFTTDVALKGREEVILRQQTEMMELSTPVVKLWDGILALPLIGTLDSERTQTVMENLLEEIVRTGAGIAIIDITGVPTVDTLVAQHLLKTVAAARLMGAECIISGIRPQIAATIVHLGIELGDVSTKSTLADAFAVALRRGNLRVVKSEAARQGSGV